MVKKNVSSKENKKHVDVLNHLNHAGKIFYWLYVDNTNTTNILHKFPLVEWDMIMFSQQYIAFYTHVSLGPIALVAGFFQLNNKLRKQKPVLHRWIGNLYLFCQLFSIPAGIWLGLHEYAGIAAVYGFIGMGGSLYCHLLLRIIIFVLEIMKHIENG